MTGRERSGVRGYTVPLFSRSVRHSVSDSETPLPGVENSFNVLAMSHHHASEIAGFELALIGVAAHAVADILCR